MVANLKIQRQIMDKVVSIRKAKKLEQRKLAELINLSASSLCNLEKNRRKLDIDWLAAIAHALEVDIEELIN